MWPKEKGVECSPDWIVCGTEMFCGCDEVFFLMRNEGGKIKVINVMIWHYSPVWGDLSFGRRLLLGLIWLRDALGLFELRGAS